MIEHSQKHRTDPFAELPTVVYSMRAAELNRVRDTLEFCRAQNPGVITPDRLAGILTFLGARAHEDKSIEQYLTAPEQRAQIDRLLTMGRRQIDSFGPTEIAATLLGLTLLGRGHERFAHLLIARGSGLLADFEPADAIKMLGAVRYVAIDPAYLLAEMENYITARKDEFDPRTLARAAKFLTQLEQPALTRMIVGVAAEKIAHFESQDLCMIALAVGRLEDRGASFIPTVASEVADRLASRPDRIAGRDAVAVLSLLGHRHVRDETFLAAFSQEMISRLPECSRGDLREIAWSYAALRERDERLLKHLGRIVAHRVTEFETPDLAMIVRSFAVLGFRSDELLIAAAEHLDDRFETFTPRDCAMIAWGFAAFDGRLSQRIVAQAAAAFPETDVPGSAARQMHIALVATGQRPPGRCPAVVSEMADGEVAAERPNDFEKCVYAALLALDRPGLKMYAKVAIEGISTDFVVIDGDRRFIIECDGPQFHLTSTGTYCGNDTLQDRVFARCGFTVVHLLFNEFQYKSPRELEASLRLKLGLARSSVGRKNLEH